jgi:quercetin dioxygenase-like cupin family protein
MRVRVPHDRGEKRLYFHRISQEVGGELMVRTHQPGQVAFRSILPEDIDWKPFPAFPPSVRLAVVVGQPSEPGPYTIRVKVPSGVKLMPHRHPEDRVYTVISGVFYIGLGDQFDGDKVKAFPPGSVVVLPGNTSHFHWAKSGEYVTQARPLVHLASNTWISAMILVRPNFPPRAACPGRRSGTRAPYDPTFRVTPRPRRYW